MFTLFSSILSIIFLFKINLYCKRFEDVLPVAKNRQVYRQLSISFYKSSNRNTLIMWTGCQSISMTDRFSDSSFRSLNPEVCRETLYFFLHFIYIIIWYFYFKIAWKGCSSCRPDSSQELLFLHQPKLSADRPPVFGMQRPHWQQMLALLLQLWSCWLYKLRGCRSVRGQLWH